MAKVAIVGVGAIGGVLAGQLELAGSHEIFLCTRRPLPILSVSAPDREISVKAHNLTTPNEASRVDWVLVATKAYDAASAAAWFPALCDSNTRVAIVQNGVEHRQRFSPYLSQEQLVPVIIDCPAERRADGSIFQRGPVDMKVETGHDGEAFAALFHGSPAAVHLTPDFLTAAWRKLCINSAGAISAILLKPSGVLRDEALGNLALEIVAECAAVGRAEGADLDEEIGPRVLAVTRASPPDSINSMLADRLAGKPMEIDARNGVIVRMGAKHGIPTPTNRMAVALLQAGHATSVAS